MRRLVVLSTAAVLAACSGDDDGSSNPNPNPNRDAGVVRDAGATVEDTFVEIAPSAAEVQQLVTQVRDDSIAGVDAQLRADVEAYVDAAFPGQGLTVQGEFMPATKAQMYSMIGAEAIMRGSLSGATWAFATAALLDLEDPKLLAHLAFCLNLLGEYELAKALLLKAREIDPEEYAARANLAYAYEKLEDLERAINELTYLSHLNPRNGRIAYELARLHRLAGNMRLAQRIAQEAKLLSPWDEDVDMLINEVGPPPMDDPDYNVTPSGTGSLIRAAGDCVVDHATDVGQAAPPFVQAAGTPPNEYWDAATTANDVNNTCLFDCGGDIACEFQCDSAYCAAVSAASATAIAKLKLVPPDYGGRMKAELTAFQECAFGALRRYGKSATDAEVEAVTRLIVDTEDVTYNGINVFYADVTGEMQFMRQDATDICTYAQQTLEMIDFPSVYAPLKPEDFTLEVCLGRFVCFNSMGGNFSLQFMIGILMAGLQIDLPTGDYTVSFGAGIADPSGRAQAAIALKFSNTMGVGIGAQAKIGGPIKAKLGQDYYVFSNF